MRRRVFILPLLLFAAFLHPYLPFNDRSWCAIKIATGFDCPGCGMIRAVSLLLHGRIAESFQMNPLGIFVVAWFLIWFFSALVWNKLNIDNTGLIAINSKVSVVFVFLLFSSWILRIL